MANLPNDNMAESSPGGTKFVIPKITDNELFRDVPLNLREFQDLWQKMILNTFVCAESAKKFIVISAKTINNKQLKEKYDERKREFMQQIRARSEKDSKDMVTFLGFRNFEQAKKVCKEGLKVGNVPFSHLGDAKMGVVLQKNADVLYAHSQPENLMTQYMIIFRTMRGKVKIVSEMSSGLEPTPGFDCHTLQQMKKGIIIPPKKQYMYSQTYVYEYGIDGIVEKPRQIYPYALIEYRFGDPKDVSINTAAKFMAAINTNNKSAPKETCLNVWSGKLYNNRTFIGCVDLLSYGMMFKPCYLPKKINICCTMPISEMKDRYFQNSTQMSIKQEVHNGNYHSSYFQLSCSDVTPEFDQFCSYLEQNAVCGVCYCGGRIEGIFFPEKAASLGIQPTQNNDKYLHCFFAAPHSLMRRMAFAREKLDKSRVCMAETNNVAAGLRVVNRNKKILQAKPSTSSDNATTEPTENFEDGFLDSPPSKLLQPEKVYELFQRQASEYQRLHPPEKMVPQLTSVFPPLSDKLFPKRAALLPTPSPRPPTISKLDPRIRTYNNVASGIANESPRMIEPVLSPTQLTPPQHVVQPMSYPDSDSDSAPYSPTQFSPIEDDPDEDTVEFCRYSSAPKTSVVETAPIVTKAAIQLPQKVLYIPSSTNKRFVKENRTNDTFFKPFGTRQDSKSGNETIPFFDDKPAAGPTKPVAKRSNPFNVELSHTNNDVTFGSIHSIDDMKSYLNASINRMGSCKNAKNTKHRKPHSDTVSEKDVISVNDESVTKTVPVAVRSPDNLVSEVRLTNRVTSTERRPSTEHKDDSCNKRVTSNPIDVVNPIREIPLQKSATKRQDPRLGSNRNSVENPKMTVEKPTAVKKPSLETAINPEVAKQVNKTVTNAITDFSAKGTEVLETNKWSRDLRMLSWQADPKAKSTVETPQIDADGNRNQLKLSSFTTIYNQEVKVEKRDENVNEIKHEVMGFTDQLMKRFENRKEENEETPDLTYETLVEEMDRFYTILGGIISVDSQLKSLLQKKMRKKHPQLSGLRALNFATTSLQKTFSDKYIDLLLKCDLKKFTCLVEQINTTLFIVSESVAKKPNGDKIQDRLKDFRQSLHQLMTHYGVGVSDDSNEATISAKGSILDKISHENIFVDAILNENRRQLSRLLDEMQKDGSLKDKRKNTCDTTNGAKRLRLMNGVSGDNGMVLHVENDNLYDDDNNTLPTTAATATAKRKRKRKVKVQNAQGLSIRVNRLVRKRNVVRRDGKVWYAKMKNCLVHYKHVKECEKDVASESCNSSILNKSIRRHCVSTTRRAKFVTRKQRRVTNSLSDLGSALVRMCSGGPLQTKRLMNKDDLNLSDMLRRLADDIDAVKEKKVKQKEKVEEPESDSNDSGETVQLQDEQEELFDSLPDAIKNGGSSRFESVDYDEEEKKNDNFSNDNYETANAEEFSIYEQPILPTEDTLYFVYGNDVNECNAVKKYLQSEKHRPYGSNNKETVAAAENGVVLYVFVHSGITEPHVIPDLHQLKNFPTTHFMMFDNVTDLVDTNCRTMFEKGGIIVADSKLLSNLSAGLINHTLSLINKKVRLEIPWTMYVHSSYISQLEKTSAGNPRSLAARNNQQMKAASLLKGLQENVNVFIMPPHECDEGDEPSHKQMLMCLREIQRTNMFTHRHIVYLSDIPANDPDSFDFLQSGVSVMTHIELANRHLISAENQEQSSPAKHN